MVTGVVPDPLRAASTQRSPALPERLIACVDGSLVCSTFVDAGSTSAGASGLIALISPIKLLSVVFQNVQFQACSSSDVPFQQLGLLPP